MTIVVAAPGTHRVRVQPNTTGYPNSWYGGTSYATADDIPLAGHTLLDSSATAVP